MIRAILFDLDGVLFDGAPLHRKWFLGAVNSAGTLLTEEYHDAQLNGLSTRQKLAKLVARGVLTDEQAAGAEAKKKEITALEIAGAVAPSATLVATLTALQVRGFTLFCVTNSIRCTALKVLEGLGVLEFFTGIVASDDVSSPKPSPEPYQVVVDRFGLEARECLILEDSLCGREAAYASGAHVLRIADPLDVTLEGVLAGTAAAAVPVGLEPVRDVNIVIPMAGRGSRFSTKGYTVPKPFIPVFSKPMIQWVIENILPTDEVYGSVRVPCKIRPRLHFVAQADHLKQYSLEDICAPKGVEFTVTPVDVVTEGPACTVLLTKKYIDTDTPLITVNSDQFLDWDVNEFYRALLNPSYDGCISTFHQPNPADTKWSFARVGADGLVCEVAEKRYISPLATTGIYGWAQGRDFVRCAEAMIAANERVNGEFYVAPVYGYRINEGGKIRTFGCRQLWGLGVPEDLEAFLTNYGGSV